MKKILFFISSMLLTFNIVSADTTYDVNYNIGYNNFSYSQYKAYVEGYSNQLLNMFETLYNYWNTNYSETYPYYYVEIVHDTSYISFEFIAIQSVNTISITSPSTVIGGNCVISQAYYYFNNNTYNYSNWTTSSYYLPSYYYGNGQGDFYGSRYFFANFDLYFSNWSTGQTVGFTSFNNQYSILLEYNQPIPSGYNYMNFTFLNDYSIDEYVEVNLNDFPYIVLSLNSYTNLVSPAIFKVLGQVCITPVYDYGTREKSSITDICTLPYSTYTDFRYWIQNSDLTNHSVFYVVGYDSSTTNKIMVNTRIFSISYISSNNANNPQVDINGRSYPIIPYSSLTNTAQSNQENGYVPGLSVNVFDVSSDSSFVSELFSNPLEALQTCWTAIISMFTLIGSFIALLPQTLQAFLFVSFSIGICLGIIKILL